MSRLSSRVASAEPNARRASPGRAPPDGLFDAGADLLVDFAAQPIAANDIR
jgi:hypothetical protein